MNFKLILIAIFSVSSVALACPICTIHNLSIQPNPLPRTLPSPTGPTQPDPGQDPGSDDGPEVPFPYTASMPFPWASIEGIWSAYSQDGTNYMFSFRVQNETTNNRVLQVLELDPETSAVVADGTGISTQGNHLVRAALSGSMGTTMIYIGLYKNPKAESSNDQAMVITIRQFSNIGPNSGSDLKLIAKRVSMIPITDGQD